MPKMKATDIGFNVDELENAEYEKYEKTYTKYEGDIPPADTVLGGQVKKMWYTLTQNDDDMLVVLVEALENKGKTEQYNHLPIWERLALTTAAKWKWAPFLDAFGMTIREVKNKMFVADEDDNIGAPITKIGSFEPGSDAAWCRFITTRENSKQYGTSAHIGEWLAWEELTDEEVDEAADEPEEEEAEVEVEEPDEEEEQKPATRGRKAPATAAKAGTAKTGRGARTATTPTRGTAKAATGRRGVRTASATAGSSDDPPF